MRKTIILNLLLAVSLTTFAQHGPPPPDDDRTESLRIAFLTNYLSLTPEESAAFWPVYNQMRAEAKTEMDAVREGMEKADIPNMSDAELRTLIDGHFRHEQTMLDIRRKYADKFTEVLPMQKVAMLTRAEEAFKREILRKARDRRPPERDGGGPRFRD
jgi:hypothetical protein